MKHLLHEREQKIIQEIIAEVEQHTSGEIVVKVVRSCSFYLWIHPVMTLAGLFISTGLYLLFAWNLHWDPPAGQLLACQGIGAAVGLLLSLIPNFKRSLISKQLQATAVHREALANFTQLGVSYTRQRTGILLFISEFEHRVVVLADKGINDKVDATYWDQEVDKVVKGIRANRASAAIVSAVTNIGAKLAEHFPHTPGDNPDELSNKLR